MRGTGYSVRGGLRCLRLFHVTVPLPTPTPRSRLACVCVFFNRVFVCSSCLVGSRIMRTTLPSRSSGRRRRSAATRCYRCCRYSSTMSPRTGRSVCRRSETLQTQNVSRFGEAFFFFSFPPPHGLMLRDGAANACEEGGGREVYGICCARDTGCVR